MKKALNTRQERFCEFIAAGEKQTDAYVKAGFKVPKSVARRNAARLRTKADIKNRVAELRAPQTAAALLTRDRKRELLARIAEDTTATRSDRIRAIEVDAKLAGHFEPDRMAVETGPSTLESIRERARNVASLMSLAYKVRDAPVLEKPPACPNPHL